MKTIKLTTLLAILFCTAMANAQTAYKTDKLAPHYFPGNEMSNVKTDIARILQNEIKWIADMKTNKYGDPKDVQVLDDRIEFILKNQKRVFNFSDMLDNTVDLDKVSMSENGGIFNLIYYTVDLGQFTINFKLNYKPGQQLIDDLYFIQYQMREKQFTSQLALFEPIAAQYRVLKVKPAVSEAQRELIVQANLYNEKKDYINAIDRYNKSIESDQTSYPAAYSNLALLSAQINKFDAAIYYMKKYLLLEPEATDARSAQDKIYEWKISATK